MPASLLLQRTRKPPTCSAAAYYELEEWNRAESSCKKAVALDPDNGRLSSFGWDAFMAKKADRAGFLAAAGLAGKVPRRIRARVQLDPKNADARVNLTEFILKRPASWAAASKKRASRRSPSQALDPAREHWVYARLAEKKKDAVTASGSIASPSRSARVTPKRGSTWLSFSRRQKRLDEMEQALVKLSHAPMPKLDVLMEAAQLLYGPAAAIPSPRICSTAISQPVRWRQLPRSGPTI